MLNIVQQPSCLWDIFICNCPERRFVKSLTNLWPSQQFSRGQHCYYSLNILVLIFMGITMSVCTCSRWAYSSSSSFYFQHQMVRDRWGRRDTTVVNRHSGLRYSPEMRYNSKTIEGSMYCNSQESIHSQRSKDTKQSEFMSVVLRWAFRFMKLFKVGAGWCAKKVLTLFPCETFYVEHFWSNLESLIACSAPVRDSCRRIFWSPRRFEGGGFIEEGGNIGESDMVQ